MQTFDPHCIEALQILSHQYLRQGKADRAEPLLELLVAVEPVNSEIRLALAYAFLCNGRPVEALKTLAALQVSRHAVAHFLRGRALAQTGRPQDARTEFARYCMLYKQAASRTMPVGPVNVPSTTRRQ
ncbi:tetratricopeptide repeat protein [Noviherbaspirillum sp.]|uniref:type III secretion apparatus assembly chaperone SctY n=1 Tax=Noviherbaspirillum sp. TaxID=1926288 RepID=UPI002B48D17E|nr:tetratricopeptide repeat protein [Noviherbaspirillum sp.]HJV80578.1 tetratricopeptide repeat protein [Noviherbaspirillum sp.]